ncbi:MAG: glycosyltransferase family 2 protein, partial [Pseudomonadota bacterium]
FKAGNLRAGLQRTDGDFIVILDADTRLFPGFLENTLGYFRDPSVAWVQTPHWFYDVPEGRPWATVLPPWAARIMGMLGGRSHVGGDPFLSGSMVFFDVIQRRRNRHGASFCCGAGSIHRRAPLYADAARLNRADRAVFGARSQAAFGAALAPTQPFRFHVSEDILTSIHLHRDPAWRSVYHPQVECRMLSPLSIEAWATQKLKYAGGTLDIARQAGTLLAGPMPWVRRLHYLATFWSYLSGLALLVLLAAPVVTLFTGVAPVDAYSLAFFFHLIPLLLANEAALAVGAKGHDGHQGRVLSVAGLPMVLQAGWSVLRGRRVRFRPTPKTPLVGPRLRFVLPHIAALAVMTLAALWGVAAHFAGSEAHTASLVIVNLFWLSWNGLAFATVIRAA